MARTREIFLPKRNNILACKLDFEDMKQELEKNQEGLFSCPISLSSASLNKTE